MQRIRSGHSASFRVTASHGALASFDKKELYSPKVEHVAKGRFDIEGFTSKDVQIVERRRKL